MHEITGEELLPNQLNQNNLHTEYKIPDNYFNELQQNILQKVKHESVEENFELNALLKQMQPEPVYQVPQQYFANLSSNILNKVNEVPVTTGKRILLQPNRALQRVLAMAAMLTLFVAGFWLIQSNPNNAFDTAAQFAQLSNEDIKAYISENSFNFNESNLYEVSGNIEDDMFLNMEIPQEELDFYLNNLDVTL